MCTVNVCDWLTAPCDQDEAELTQDGGSVVGLGLLPCCCGLNGFLGRGALVFLPRGNVRSGQGGEPACLAPKPGERVPYHPQSAVLG